LLGLQSDLEELIQLTEENVESTDDVEEESSNLNEEPKTHLDDEYDLFKV
jgi:hypothetical protein